MRPLRVRRILVEGVENLLFALRYGVAVEDAHRRHSHGFRRCRGVKQRGLQIMIHVRRRRRRASDNAGAAEVSQGSGGVRTVKRRTAGNGGRTVHPRRSVGVTTATAASFGTDRRRVEEVYGVGRDQTGSGACGG